jgi:hypothetical protein
MVPYAPHERKGPRTVTSANQWKMTRAATHPLNFELAPPLAHVGKGLPLLLKPIQEGSAGKRLVRRHGSC